MSPELLRIARERINLGHAIEKIQTELESEGYEKLAIEQACEQVKENAPSSTIVPTPPSSEDVPAVESGLGGDKQVVLPAAGTLFKEGWDFAINRPDLILALLAPLLLLPFVTYLVEAEVLGGGVVEGGAISMILAALVAVGFGVLNHGVITYVVSELPERRVGYNEAFGWSKKHILGLICIGTLVFMVVYGGMMLLFPKNTPRRKPGDVGSFCIACDTGQTTKLFD